jgi:hypothetical protein
MNLLDACKLALDKFRLIYIKIEAGEYGNDLQELYDDESVWPLKALRETISEAEQAIPAEDRYGREPDKIKPLAQYLDEYIEHEAELGNVEPTVAYMYAYKSWRELLEQALDAYESTERVKIRIEKV